MGRRPNELRHIIAANIHAERKKKYPGHGGCKKCAEALGIPPPQWSPWETGRRTPKKFRLQQIAEHFGVSVEYLGQDHAQPETNPDARSLMSSGSEAVIPEVLLYGLSCSESENVWQVHKTYSASANNGQRWHVSLSIVLSKEAQKEA